MSLPRVFARLVWYAEAHSMAVLHPGQMLAGTSYQIVREIGAGGMGVVYEIEHVRLKKRYVAKVIHEQIKHEDGALKRMEREAQVLAGITHPNIVQVHDFGTTADDVTYFVMEKLEGVDLRRFMKKRGVKRTRAIDITIDVLEALAHVHKQGIVHRDIKPENIFLAEQMGHTTTKVLDFGIVSIVNGDGRLSQGRITKTGGFVGTLYYAAPEQMQGKPPGPANDVYACGLVLFEMLAGKGPFDDDPGVGLSRCFKQAPRLSDTTDTPRELSDLVARALEQDPGARPNAALLARDLRAIRDRLNLANDGKPEDPVRAEVDDLLAQFAPVEHTPPRQQMSKAAVVSHGPGRDAPANASANVNAMGFEPTAVPPTPVMANAPPRPAAGAPFEPTMASEPDGPAVPIAAGIQGQARAPVANAIVDYATQASAKHDAAALLPSPSPTAPVVTKAGIGQSPQTLPHGAQGQGQGPQGQPVPRGSYPGHPAHAVSAPPPSPRFAAPASTQHGVGPSMPAATPNARMQSGDTSTSPGLYATVDEYPISSKTGAAPRSSAPLAILAAAGGVLVLVGLIVTGVMFFRHSSTASASSPLESAAPASGEAPSSTARATEPTSTAAASTTAVASASPSSSPSSNASAAAVTTSAASVGKPVVLTNTPPAARTPAAPVTPRNGGAATPPTPPPAPSPPPNKGAADKEGYVKTL